MTFKRAMLWVVWVTIGLMFGAMVAMLSYDHFVDRVLGDPGRALPPEVTDAPIDAAVERLIQAHPGQTGLRLIDDNLDAFARRALSARRAIRSIDVQYYIWHNDRTGRLLAQELVKAADRGVRVRVLLDDVNIRGQDDAIFALDTHPGIEVRLFNPARNRAGFIRRPIELLLRSVSLNRRMHNKSWIVDGRIAIVGGRNIGDEYFDAASEVNFQDADLLLAGAAVTQASEIFDQFWNSREVIPIAMLHKEPNLTLDEARTRLAKTEAESQASPYMKRLQESSSMQKLLSDPLNLFWSDGVQVWSDPPEKANALDDQQLREQWLINRLTPLLESSKHEVQLISPYFVPGNAGADMMIAKAKAGVGVSVLTNSLASTDVAMVHAGYVRYRSRLLAGGVTLHELMPRRQQRLSLIGSSRASLHTKALIVDGESGFVGSFNVDSRSAQLNTEMGVKFSDPRLAQQLRESFKRSTAPNSSYRVYLEGNELRWEDRSGAEPCIWVTEPESNWWRRTVATLVRALPIESQL